MRAVLTGDLDAAARALAAVAAADRPALIALMLARAHSADKFRKRTGRAHPLWGPGTLAGAAGRLPLAPPPRRFDAPACAALSAALAGIALWRADRAPFRFKLARPSGLR